MQKPVNRRWSARRISFVICLTVLLGLAVVAVSAQAVWSTLETEHFYIHFDVELAPFAEQIAWRAEHVHNELVARLGHAPKTKTHIVVRDDSDAANGYATPVYENQIIIYPTFPSMAIGYLNGFDFTFHDWLTLLLMHEYTHILHMDMRSPSSETIASVLGRVPFLTSPIVLTSPLVLEGYAVYHESQLGYGRGNSSYYDMYLRTAALSGRLPEVDQVLGEYPLERWQPGGHVYFYGHAFLNYVAERFGQDTLMQINASLVRRPDSLARAIAQATGHSLAHLWRDWQTESMRTARTDAARIAAEPLTLTYPLKTIGHHALFPAPAPDAPAVAYIALGGVTPAVRLIDLQTKKEHSLATMQGMLTEDIAWHPNGGHVVVSTLQDDGAGRTRTHLVQVDTTTGSIRQLPHTERAYSPTYDPLGQRLAYIVRSGVHTELRMRHMETGGDVTLFSDSSLHLLSVNWSPNGDQLALSIWNTADGPFIALYDLVEARLIPIVGREGNYVSPAWSRDGNTLLFSSDRTGVFNLYAYDVVHHTLRRLTNTVTGLFHPRMTHDGALIATEYTADGYQLVELSYEPEQGTLEPVTLPSLGRHSFEVARTPILGYKRYAPWASLMPKFWLPSVQEMAGETHFGVMTAGQDILGHTAYTAFSSFGLSSGRLSYDLDLVQTIGGSGHWALNARASDGPVVRSVNTIPVWHERSQLSAGLRWQGSLGQGNQAAWVQGSHASEVAMDSGDRPATYNRLEVGWEGQVTDGQLGMRTRYQLRVRGSKELGRDDAWFVVTEQAKEYQWSGGKSLLFALNLGISGSEQSMSLGRGADVFSLRGYRGKHWGGNMVLRAQVEGRVPLYRIERGLLDSPVFLRDIALHPFFEMGYAQVWRTEAKQRTFALGAEIGFDTFLGYGATRADWRIGIAHGMGEPYPQVFLRVVSRF